VGINYVRPTDVEQIGTELGGSFAPLQDTLSLIALERNGVQTARRYAGQHVIDYQDAVEVTQSWASLSGLPNAGVQVSSNKLYANSTETNPVAAYIPLTRNVTAGEKFHIATTIEFTSQDTGSFVYFGLSQRAYNSVTNPNSTYSEEIMIGMTGSSNTLNWYRGSNVSGVAASTTIPNMGTTAAGRYHVTIDGSALGICFAFRRAGTGNSDSTSQYVVPISALTGKTFGQLCAAVGDTRGLTGHAIGPVAAVIASSQPTRTKTVGGIQVESAVQRDITYTATSGDKWRLSLPATYDPRKPAPLAIHLHPAGSSVSGELRPWEISNEILLSNALASAGYIVASAQDGATANDSTTDRYANDASMLNHKDMYEWIRSQFAIGPVVLYGRSMGGSVGLNLIARRTIPNIVAGYFMVPGTDWDPDVLLSTAETIAAYQQGFYNAYGVASTAALRTALNGHSPADREGWEFRGTAIRLVEVLDDVTAPPATHVDPFLAKITPYAAEASKRTVASGGHDTASAYSASDMMTFFNTYVA
jgi:pimeloyl-ACP methyl ester carboxylesterase